MFALPQPNSLRPPLPKKPRAYRFFLLAVALALFTHVAPLAAEENPLPLTEREVLDSALSSEVFSAQLQARKQAAEARVLEASLLPNPDLAIEHEQSFREPSANTETSLTIAQSFQVSGRRRLLTEAARTDVSAVALESRADKAALASMVRTAFYELLLAQNLSDAHEAALKRLQELIALLEHRVEVGDASPYELERLRLEAAELRAALSEHRAALSEHRAHLSAWLPTDHAVIAQGELLPTALPDDAALEVAFDEHPRFLAAEDHIAGLHLRRQAEDRWWLPDFRLEGGVALGSHPGFIVGLGIELPVFQRRQARRQELEARALEQRWSTRVERDILGARAASLASQARSLRGAAQEYGTDGLQRAHRVLRLARQSYDAGEATILELIDAYQSVLAAETRAAELAARSRRAHLDLLELLSSTLPGETP